MRWGTRPVGRFGDGSTLNELAQHPVMVQFGIVQLTRYRGLPGRQQQRAALLTGKAGALQKVRHPLDPWRPLARRQGSARRRGQNRRPRVVRGLGRRMMAVSELPQPGRFRLGQHVIHHSVQVGQMPAGSQHCGQVFGWHVALLSQSIQECAAFAAG